MDKVFLAVLIMAFGGVLAFMVANTTVGIMIPILDNASASMPFMKGSGLDYNTTKDLFVNAFFTGIFIVVCIPFAYLLIRIIREEKEPEERQYYPYYPGG